MRLALVLSLALLLSACDNATQAPPDLTQLRRDLLTVQVALDRVDISRGFWQAPELVQRRDALLVTYQVEKAKLDQERLSDMQFTLTALDDFIKIAMLDTKLGTPEFHKAAADNLRIAKNFLASTIRNLEPTPPPAPRR